MNRARARAKRATTSGSGVAGATTVTRMLCTSRRFGVPMRFRRKAHRNAVQRPGGREPLGVGEGRPGAHVVLRQLVRGHDPSEHVVVGALRVQPVVAVQVLGVEEPVPHRAPAAEVAPRINGHRFRQDVGAGLDIGLERAVHVERVDPIQQDPDVVGGCIEDAGGLALAVEQADTGVMSPGVEAVGAGDGQALRRHGQGVLVDRAQVDDQLHPGRVGGLFPALEHPKLEILGPRKIDAALGQRGDQRAPPRGERPVGLAPERRHCWSAPSRQPCRPER